MPARRTTRDARGADRRADGQDAAAYEETDAEEEQGYEEDDEDYSGDGSQERSEGQRRSRSSRRGRGSSRISAAQAAQAGLRGLVDLIGKQPEGVTSVEPTEDGWLIGVEVIEDQRVPSSADVMAIYEAELDADGDLLSYRRTSRYSRGRGDQAKES